MHPHHTVPCIARHRAGFFLLRLASGGLRFTLEIVMQPITKHERRVQNDQRGADRYARRRHIDQKLRDMQLARQLREAWE